MKIAFNMLECGLGNNGGTRTIIKCVETLEKLGHKCDIIATTDNFTWFKHKSTIQHIPSDLDVLVATACTTVDSTLRANVPKKAWYIRGHENWTMSDEELVIRYNSDIFNIVNSKGLQQLLSSYGADSMVVYQGVDFDLWYPMDYVRMEDGITIGCLYQKKKTKRWNDFVKLSKILGDDNYTYIGFGNDKIDEDFLFAYWQRPSLDAQREMYSNCHIWFAPTELEGLHNVPIEANLCGCLVVCGDEPMNGMIYDYAFPNNTAVVYNRKDIEHAAELIRVPDWSLIKNMQQHLKYHIGTREDNMKKMIKYLENY